ncbi:MAG TPA: hypothetical protein VHS30_34705 [Streptosporangiaceae bacterium]|jgi:hypothetical protein|nr:hypothetical protein [Streptosporangiaceae bacterium]
MAADATDQTTAAKTESASQSTYMGAGKETVTVYAGNIEQIGRRSDGSRNVVFRSASSTFDTQWPKWAYQIAMAAYLYDKQIQVIADGQPDGDKLRSVNLILPVHPPRQGPQPAHHRPLTSENSTACLDSDAPGRGGSDQGGAEGDQGDLPADHPASGQTYLTWLLVMLLSRLNRPNIRRSPDAAAEALRRTLIKGNQTRFPGAKEEPCAR